VIARIASALCALLVVVGCKDNPAAAPPPKREPVGVRQSPTTQVVPVDAPVADAAVVAVPVDAAPLAPASKAERTMVEAGFKRLSGAEKLAIKGVDHEPFRKTHAGVTFDARTVVGRAPAPTERAMTKTDKRTFVVTELAGSDGTRSSTRLVMTFDAKGALVGISY